MSAVLNKEKIFLQYYDAEIISPPPELDPIFVTEHTSDESLKNLALTYSLIPLVHRQGLQLFEIPPIEDDCQQYCGRAYSPYTPRVVRDWQPKKDEDWVLLADKTDFSCRKHFEKVFVYESRYHYGRQWGDGTILEKCGYTRNGATAVYRLLDPHHPFVQRYGKVEAIWIRPFGKDIPHPYLRSQSTYRCGKCNKCDDFSSFPRVAQYSITEWEPHYKQLQEQVEKLRQERGS